MSGWRGPQGWHGARRDRLVAGAASAAVVAGLGYALLVGLGVDIVRRAETPLVALTILPPPPPPPPEPVHRLSRKTRPSGASAPAGERHPPVRPRPFVAPIPIVVPPAPVVIASAPTGASHGAGTGAGGRGNGTGSGDAGDGDGDGDDTPPERVRGALNIADLPRDLRHGSGHWTVEVRYYVNVDGSVSGCTVTHSSGNAELDGETCRLIEKRFRYEPSRDSDGRPVRSIIGEERHIWDFERDDGDD